MKLFDIIPKQDFRFILHGILMGGADIIPGVSGGTVALILGIYERLVTAISRFDRTFLRLLGQRRWLDAGAHIDGSFLLTLGCGIATGIASLATLMHYLLEHQRQHTFAVFFGLILASSVLVARMLERWDVRSIVVAIIGTGFAYWLVGQLPTDPGEGYFYLFLCGMVAICAMILPGISGAFILLILGKYDDITGVLRDFLHFNGSVQAFFSLVAFGAGCAVGLLSFSKFLRWLLGRHQAMTMALLCGFMLGSLRKIWPFKVDLTEHILDFKRKQFANIWPEQFDGNVLLSLVMMLFAVAFVFVLDRLTDGHEKPTLPEDSTATS